MPIFIIPKLSYLYHAYRIEASHHTYHHTSEVVLTLEGLGSHRGHPRPLLQQPPLV